MIIADTVIVPVFIPVEDDKCPHCGKTENIKQVCRHCGYEYPEDENSFWFNFIATFCVIYLFYSAITVIVWLMNLQFENDHQTLTDVLRWQWNFIHQLRLW
jgi:NADH:ubiquinone oxidoreductase subunit C